MAHIYQAGCTEKVKSLEQELNKELQELKNELEENEMVHGLQRSISSVLLPKDVEHFRRERGVVIDRALQVTEVKPLIVQADVMKEELINVSKSDYTPEGMPLLLHQYFCERIRQLVQCKHMHMLRWKRFCEHSSTIEALYPLYQQRLANIMSEYNDCLQRSERLAASREAMLAGNASAISAVKVDDMLIYLRWLVCHLHSVKKFNQYMKVLQWLPVVHKTALKPDPPEESDEDGVSSTRIPSRYQDDAQFPGSQVKVVSRPASEASVHTSSAKVPPLNPLLLSSSPVPALQSVWAAAATGGGYASDENSLGLPLHVNDLESLRANLNFLANLYGIPVNVENIQSSSEEMELYGAVNRKFKQVFTRQEHMKTFKTYDRIEIGQENWGADTYLHALTQESTWVPFITVHPEIDPVQTKRMTELRTKMNVDELLRVQSHFLQVSDPEKVQETLREHAHLIREPEQILPVSVTSNRTAQHTGITWKTIYTNPELYSKEKRSEEKAAQDFDEKDADNVSFGRRSRGQSARKRRDSYDYVDTVQLLGLDDGDQDSSDPSSIQGAFLSFLMLRQLRMRDLQRTCLSILNYFRSVERTLTINDGGLSLEAGSARRTSAQNHRKGNVDGSLGGGGGLGSHQYMHSTPRDFKLNESEFMEFAEVDNHDDFYTVEDGRVQVQDQRGYFIVYNSAQEDMKKLEKDLLLIATHFIEKDRDLRNASGIKRSSSAKRRSTSTAGDFDIASYAHQEVDRFGVLFDMWTSETAYLESKKELLDCYLEAYHHVFDRDEKRLLTQVITNIMHQRPRYDFEAPYFVKTYRLESICLRLHTTLVKSILDKQIEEQREYTSRVCRDGDSEFGLPHKVVAKQPISVNMSRSALRNIYMLEFHPSLAVASRLPTSLKHAFWELYHMHKPDNITDMIVMERKMMEIALQEWQQMAALGSSFTMQTQKDVFSDVFVEDPLFICEIAQTLVTQLETQSSRSSQKDKHKTALNTVGRLMNALTVRYRLLDAAWETEVLSKIYRKQAVEMGFDECHLFLRFVQFEFANFKEDAAKPPPIFITAIQEDDSSVDRYTPAHLYLAIHELDESHCGRFSFRSRDGILQIMKGNSLETIKVALMCQVVHKNSLIAAVQQANVCQPSKESNFTASGRPLTPTETKSEKSSMTAMTGMSSNTQMTSLASKLRDGGGRYGRSPEAFVSLQLEKTPSRDVMLNEFIGKKSSMGTVLKNAEKMEELKRKLIESYCYNFNHRVAQYSLRSQLIAYYNSILGLLEGFPNIRDTYFVMGEMNEKKAKNADSLEGLTPDPRTLTKRPRRLLSEDGLHLLNLWFIPHHSEILVMFKKLDDESCVKALGHCLHIVSSLHDILQYLCAHARLGSSHARLGSKKVEFVSADWGGTEGVGAELRDIQKQINHLTDSTNPEQIVEFLRLRKEVMYLEFDVSIRHAMRDTFLSTGNVPAFKAITNCMHFALHDLSNAQRDTVLSTYLNVPEPMEARDFKAQELYPWRSFLNREGPYPISFWQWQQIEFNSQLCLAGLKEVDRQVANGEILGVSLLMEDVLMSGQFDQAAFAASDTDDDRSSVRTTPPQSRPGSRTGQRSHLHGSKVTLPGSDKKLSRTTQPVEAYKLLKSFLLLWKQLEVMKGDWGKRKLGLERIETTAAYKEFCLEYKKDRLYPVLQSVARRYGQGDLYEGMISDYEPLVIPHGASEMEVRTKQLLKLLEDLECHMISEVRKKLAKELNLVLAERSREESALPTDLWKRPAMKESYTIAKPHVAEDFIDQLKSDCKESGEEITFSMKHLNTCLSQLARSVMARERQNYDSYTMYYENLLRVNHQLLYQKEQELKQLRSQLKTAQNNTLVEVQCQMADQSYDLLMEITALRAKIAEMREISLTQERDMRERVKEEYDDLVRNLFSSAFELKTKFDEFRHELVDDVLDKIRDTRTEAMESMTRLKQKMGSGRDEEESQRKLAQANTLRAIQQDNHSLNSAMLCMKIMNNWKQNLSTRQYNKQLTHFKRDADHSKKEYLKVRMLAEEEVILLRQQLLAVRKALADSVAECNEIKKDLDKELKVKKEKLHSAQQEAASRRQLELAKQANVEKLLSELEERELQLRQVALEMDRNLKYHQISEDKSRKDVVTIKKQLAHERNLKLDAFQRVDELQTQVYDIESGFGSRPQTAGALRISSASTSGRKTRIGSSPGVRGPRSAVSSASSVWPPAITWPANRSLTPDSPPNNMEKKIQRPKTTVGRLRSKVAEQLLNDLDPPDHHEVLIKLKEKNI